MGANCCNVGTKAMVQGARAAAWYSPWDSPGHPYLTPSPSASRGQTCSRTCCLCCFMRTIREIINTFVTTGVRQNPVNVYMLLHRQDVFEPFTVHARFADISNNIQIVIDSFNHKVDNGQHREGWSGRVTDVLGIIKERLSSSGSQIGCLDTRSYTLLI
ncbi:hypothetical protein WJX77_008929 [Trebouxia sp. C0004]